MVGRVLVTIPVNKFWPTCKQAPAILRKSPSSCSHNSSGTSLAWHGQKQHPGCGRGFFIHCKSEEQTLKDALEGESWNSVKYIWRCGKICSFVYWLSKYAKCGLQICVWLTFLLQPHLDFFFNLNSTRNTSLGDSYFWSFAVFEERC